MGFLGKAASWVTGFLSRKALLGVGVAGASVAGAAYVDAKKNGHENLLSGVIQTTAETVTKPAAIAAVNTTLTSWYATIGAIGKFIMTLTNGAYGQGLIDFAKRGHAGNNDTQSKKDKDAGDGILDGPKKFLKTEFPVAAQAALNAADEGLTRIEKVMPDALDGGSKAGAAAWAVAGGAAGLWGANKLVRGVFSLFKGGTAATGSVIATAAPAAAAAAAAPVAAATVAKSASLGGRILSALTGKWGKIAALGTALTAGAIAMNDADAAQAPSTPNNPATATSATPSATAPAATGNPAPSTPQTTPTDKGEVSFTNLYNGLVDTTWGDVAPKAGIVLNGAGESVATTLGSVTGHIADLGDWTVGKALGWIGVDTGYKKRDLSKEFSEGAERAYRTVVAPPTLVTAGDKVAFAFGQVAPYVIPAGAAVRAAQIVGAITEVAGAVTEPAPAAPTQVQPAPRQQHTPMAP